MKKLKYPLIKKSLSTDYAFCVFIQLVDIKPERVKDTIIAYDSKELMVNVDLDKNDNPCGIEIIYYKIREKK